MKPINSRPKFSFLNQMNTSILVVWVLVWPEKITLRIRHPRLKLRLSLAKMFGKSSIFVYPTTYGLTTFHTPLYDTRALQVHAVSKCFL